MDGYGLAPADPGNAIALGEDARRSTGCSPSARGRRSPARARRSGCPRGRWATPRWATSTSARAASSIRSSPASTTRSRTAPCGRTRCCWRRSTPPWRPRRAVHFMGLVSDGGVHSHIDHLFACSTSRRSAARGGSTCTRSSTGATCRRPRGWDSSRRSGTGSSELGVGRDRDASCGRYYAMDRDKRWERVRDAPGGCSSSARAASRPTPSTPSERATTPASPTSSSSRSCSRAGRAACATATRSSSSTSGPTVRARSRARSWTRRFDGFERPETPRLRFVCLTRVRPDDPGTGRFREGPALVHARGRARRSGAAAAAHRRDREVRARHLLPQRRRRAAEDRGRSVSSCRARRSPPTTCSRR